MDSEGHNSNTTVWILVCCLIILLALLFFLYKKLNKQTNGEYTIQHIVYKEGGVRDQVRGAVTALETRLGVQLWPRGHSDEDGEEMEEMQDEEGQVERGSSQGSDSEGEDRDEEEEGEKSGNDSETSGDDSSTASCEVGETVRLMDQEAKGEEGEEEKEERGGEQEGKGDASGAPGLLIDLKQFSGSATWSAEGVCQGGDVTAL